jgi:hypothetical protein
MSCPCGLSRTEVLEVTEKRGVRLVAGRSRNPLADGTDGTSGKALGAHPLTIGKALHLLQDLLCVESYVFMSPFYYCNYQSILFCAEFIKSKITLSSVPSSDPLHSA